MNRKKWIKAFKKLLTALEKIRANQAFYEKTYRMWEKIMDDEMDGLISEFAFELTKEAQDTIDGEPNE